MPSFTVFYVEVRPRSTTRSYRSQVISFLLRVGQKDKRVVSGTLIFELYLKVSFTRGLGRAFDANVYLTFCRFFIPGTGAVRNNPTLLQLHIFKYLQLLPFLKHIGHLTATSCTDHHLVRTVYHDQYNSQTLVLLTPSSPHLVHSQLSIYVLTTSHD